MRVKKLKFKKEIVANLSDAEIKQIKGGSCVSCDFKCLSGSGLTICCGGSEYECAPV